MDKKKRMCELRVFAEEIRVTALKEFQALGFGHVGGAMSIVETLSVLYGQYMKVDPKNPRDPDRDWLVVSKGHAGPAVYATLALKGFFPLETLMTLNKNGTTLPSHCDRNLTPGIDMTTGSLGQGMSTAIGAALGNRLDKRASHTFLIIGDGECNEGQIWEGAMSAAHFKLSNLIAFCDRNGQQLDGYTKNVLDMGDMAQKWNAFGWYVQEINGHDIAAVFDAVANAKAQTDKPSMIVLNTKKGNGCNFAEGVEANHHMRFTPEQMAGALEVAEKVLADAKAACPA